jgi:hypothetical protein
MARTIRRKADKKFVADLRNLAANPWQEHSLREIAHNAADLFERFWVNTTRSGSAMPEGFRLKLYGNWCGPGHSGGPCIDALDCLCMAHDLEYERAAQVERLS